MLVSKFDCLFLCLLAVFAVSCRSEVGGEFQSPQFLQYSNESESTQFSFDMGCPNVAQVEVGDLDMAVPSFLDEVSGLAVNPEMPQVLIVHNDSGDGPYFYAIDQFGKHIKKFKHGGNNGNARDVEDIEIAINPNTGQYAIYLFDIGDNYHQYHNKYIYRVPFPTIQQLTASEHTVDLSAQTEIIRFQYENDERMDSEAAIIDPASGEILLIEKVQKNDQINGQPERVFTLGANYQVGGYVNEAVDAGVGNLVDFTNQPTTAADIAADPSGGAIIVVRSYADYGGLYKQEPGQTVAQALATEPCPVPMEISNQGESVGFVRNSEGGVIGYGTVPELLFAPVSYFLVVP